MSDVAPSQPNSAADMDPLKNHLESFPKQPSTSLPDQRGSLTSKVIRAGLLTTDVTRRFTEAALSKGFLVFEDQVSNM